MYSNFNMERNYKFFKYNNFNYLYITQIVRKYMVSG